MQNQGDDYETGCLLDYNYVKDYYKTIAVDLSEQQALDADRKAIQKLILLKTLKSDNNFYYCRNKTKIFRFFNINIKWVNITP